MDQDQFIKNHAIYAPLDVDYERNSMDLRYGYGKLVQTIGSKWYKQGLYILGLLGLIAFFCYQFFIVKDAPFLDGFSKDESFRTFAPLVILGIFGIATSYYILACFCKVELYQYGFVIKQFLGTKAYSYDDIVEITHHVAVEPHNSQRRNAVWVPECFRTTDIYYFTFRNAVPAEIKSDIYARLKSKMTNLQQNLVNER